MILASFYFALKHDGRQGIFLSGLFAGLSILTRYQTLFIVIWLVPFFMVHEKKRKNILFFLLPFGLSSILVLAYNYICFSDPLTFPSMKYVYMEKKSIQVIQFRIPSMKKIELMLISPWRGLFFFSPFLIYSLSGFFQMCREQWKKGMLIVCSSLSFFSFFAFFVLWRGGADFGFRYITPALPFFSLAACFMYERIRYRMLFIFLSVFSILVCTLGVVTSPFSPAYHNLNPDHLLSLLNFNLTHLFVRGTNSLLNDILRHFGLMNVELSIYTTLMVFLAFYFIWREELHSEDPGVSSQDVSVRKNP